MYSALLIYVDVDCVWGSYGEWSECSSTCSIGTRERRRVKTIQESGTGTCDGDATQTEPCNSDISCLQGKEITTFWYIIFMYSHIVMWFRYIICNFTFFNNHKNQRSRGQQLKPQSRLPQRRQLQQLSLQKLQYQRKKLVQTMEALQLPVVSYAVPQNAANVEEKVVPTDLVENQIVALSKS